MSIEIQEARREFSRLAPRYLSGHNAAITRADVAWMRPRPGEIVLDVGCGPGIYTWAIERYTRAPIYGVDVSDMMLRRAVRGPGRTVRAHHPWFLAAEASRLPFPDRFADLVVCTFCFPHFANADRVAGEFFRVLRPGGRAAVIEVVADSRMVDRLERLRQRIFTCVRSAAQLTRLFTGTGFELQRCRHSLRWNSFRRWVEGSNLKPDATAIQQARSLLLWSGAQPDNTLGSYQNGNDLVFAYPVMAFLFRRNLGESAGI